eukprot:1527492-Pyramimonas_sp.AAC.1
MAETLHCKLVVMSSKAVLGAPTRRAPRLARRARYDAKDFALGYRGTPKGNRVRLGQVAFVWVDMYID